MQTIKVNKEILLNKLRENREHHVNTYENVLQAYKEKSIELLNEHIERIRNGSIEKIYVSLPQPQNYEKEYDLAIDMVEWHQDNIIELDDMDFDRYVRDNWQWKHNFQTVNSTYVDYVDHVDDEG